MSNRPTQDTHLHKLVPDHLLQLELGNDHLHLEAPHVVDGVVERGGVEVLHHGVEALLAADERRQQDVHGDGLAGVGEFQDVGSELLRHAWRRKRGKVVLKVISKPFYLF